MGGPERIERTLRRLRGHASCIIGDICKNVIENPALAKMWEGAKLDKRYQSEAETIKKKVDK